MSRNSERSAEREEREAMRWIVTGLVALGLATTALADGAAVFKAKCAVCHGQDGQGGAMYKKSIRGEEEPEVIQMVKKGKGKMPAVKGISDEDASAVAKYVAGLKK